MHHRITCMYANFQQNRLSRPVKTFTQIYLQKIRKLHEFATTNSNFEKWIISYYASSYNVHVNNNAK